MSMDDEDSKIRRNLVTASAIVIVTAWLDVSVPDILERVFSLKAPAVPALEIAAWKVWSAILAVLLYFVWRYRWSDEVEKGMKSHNEAAVLRYQHLIHGTYLENVGRWAVSGTYPADVDPLLAKLVDAGLRLYGAVNQPRPQTVVISPIGLQHPSAHTAQVHVYGEWDPPREEETLGGMSVGTRGASIEIPIDKRRVDRYWLAARVFAHLNSKASMALAWPFGLWIVAAGITSYRLVNAFCDA